MADDDYDDNEQPEEQNPRDLRNQLKVAKAQAKEADSLRAEIARLTTDGVIRDAGLTLNALQKVALQAAHTGEWTPDALKKSALELGFISPPEPVVDDPSLGQIAQISAASAGTDAPPASRDAEIDAKLANATTEAEFLEIYRASGRSISL